MTRDYFIYSEENENNEIISELGLILVGFAIFTIGSIVACYKFCSYRNADKFSKSESCPELNCDKRITTEYIVRSHTVV